MLARFQAAAQSAGKPWRMCETASFSGGGKEGVSDTVAAALWALDYLFVLAEHGCSGVNMETGVNHLGGISHYTPISDDLKINMDDYEYDGHAGPLYIILPDNYAGPKEKFVLKSFPGYRRWYGSKLSDKYVLYQAP